MEPLLQPDEHGHRVCHFATGPTPALHVFLTLTAQKQLQCTAANAAFNSSRKYTAEVTPVVHGQGQAQGTILLICRIGADIVKESFHRWWLAWRGEEWRRAERFSRKVARASRTGLRGEVQAGAKASSRAA